MKSHPDHNHHEHAKVKEKAQVQLEQTREEHREKAMHAHDDAEPGHGSHGSAEESHPGHDHHGMMIDEFRKKFWISLILSIPVILLSPMVQHIIGFQLTFPGAQYAVLVIASVIFFYGGSPFLKGFIDELKQKSAGMMTLIALAISVAYLYSTATVFGLQGMDFYWELATLIVIMLLGHWLEMKSVKGASKALELLVDMMPSEAYRLDNGNIVKVRLEEINKGDLLLIRPGEKVPVDGIVEEGESHINESMLTGESKPVKKEKNDNVIGGSLNGNGSLKVRVEYTGSESYLNKVIKLVEDAQKTKSSTQALADKAAKWLTYVALSVGFITFAAWLFAGKELDFALERMVTVMVISCPHALGLAVPLVVAISTAMSAKKGLLIRNRTAFENARKITTIIFDKTGTLTEGSHVVTAIETYDKTISPDEMLRLAAGVEQNSEHYISQGILKKAKNLNLRIPESERFNYLPGKGLEGQVEGKEVKVVGPNFISEFNIKVPGGNAEEGVETLVYVIVSDKVTGYITLRDKIRDESAEAITILKQHGIKNLLLTGDNERVAANVSQALKMDGFIANVLPHQKQEKVKEYQKKGEFVAMTGDGVNDAPALAQANVGIAVGSGTDVAAETADIILVNSNPKDIASLILFGKSTYNKMIQNLIWATAYNIVALPLAAGILYNQGVVISPAIGAVLMSISTIIVALNAQLLRRKIT
jgi:Cu2+-exporting ATPase